MCNVKCVKADMLMPVIKEILTKGRSARITVTGMSMYPFLREAIDSVELSPACYEDVRRGDIVLITRDSGEYVLHRVVWKKRESFCMAGDAQQWIEGPLRPEQLAAVATAVWRREKRIECASTGWRILSAVWLHLLPFRHLIIKSFSRFHRAIKLFGQERV